MANAENLCFCFIDLIHPLEERASSSSFLLPHHVPSSKVNHLHAKAKATKINGQKSGMNIPSPSLLTDQNKTKTMMDDEPTNERLVLQFSLSGLATTHSRDQLRPTQQHTLIMLVVDDNNHHWPNIQFIYSSSNFGLVIFLK